MSCWSGGRSAFRRDPRFASRLKALLPLLCAPLAAQPVPEVVVVASQLRAAELASVPASLTVLDRATVEAAAVQHFEELIPLVPNLNWSGEGSRARYFQVRGTGELEQYQGAPNPSVGFLVDDIDLSGLGGVATSFDVDRVEVLRGPQGTRYGANALAGLVYVESAAPTATPEARVTVTAGSEDTLAAGAVVSGPLGGPGAALAGRIAVQQYRSDGFRNNVYLGRDDTSDRDELTARARLHWQPSAGIDLHLTALHVDLDNGYDDFALDSGFTTRSDVPGEDSQETDAAALKATLPLGAAAELTSISTVASSDSVYAFDADWGNPGFWAPFTYDFTTRIARGRDTLTQELRLASRPGHAWLGADGVAGVYLQDLREDVAEAYTANCPAATCGVDLIYDADDTATRSRYDATNLAAYAELGWAPGPATRLTAGLRREVRDAEYTDSAGNRVDPVDRMWGGDLTLTRELGTGGAAPATVWGRIARGYRAGGFNPSVLAFPGEERGLEFGPESLWNYEVGVRGGDRDGHWWAAASVFLQDRVDPQVKIPGQLASDPNTFVFLTENAERARIEGLELEARWRPAAAAFAGRLTIGAALGLLDTEIREFTARPALEGREQAHAPGYTLALTGEWRTPAGWFGRAELGAREGFVIDYCQVDSCSSPDPETDPYQVLDLAAGREWGPWSVTAWVRNLLDETYAVRGFFFGNEPPDFVPTLYTRPGDPRQLGVTVAYAWQEP